MFIYLIVNHTTGKYYVGQHKGNNLRKYLQDKLSHSKYKTAGRSRLFNSMRKNPLPCDWSIHALLSDIQTRPELDTYERDFILFLRSQDPEFGYNICRGGEGFSGPHSPETRQKIAAASKEMWNRPGVKENFTARTTGQKRPPHVGQAVRLARLGTKASLETIEKLRNSHIGIASSRRKSVLCTDTEEIFPSLKHVVERFGGCTTNLSRAIKQGYQFFGKRFEYEK